MIVTSMRTALRAPVDQVDTIFILSSPTQTNPGCGIDSMTLSTIENASSCYRLMDST